MQVFLAILLLVCLAMLGCATNPPSQTETADTETPFPARAYQPIPNKEVGSSLENVMRKLGKFDMIGDLVIAPDGVSYGYPFSNRNGFDYFVTIDSNQQVTKAWRRQALTHPALLAQPR